MQRELGVVSALAAPIGARGRHFGVLGVHSRHAGRLQRRRRPLPQALANVLGAAAERARHEDAVRDNEARFRELADTTPALMWMTDSEGHVTFVNEGWLRFTGRTLEEELGDTFASSAHPDDRGELLGRWREAFRRRERVRWRVPPASRTLGRPPLGARGRHAALRRAASSWATSAPTTDIHERQQMEDALRESEASFRDLADTAPVMIWTTDDARPS